MHEFVQIENLFKKLNIGEPIRYYPYSLFLPIFVIGTIDRTAHARWRVMSLEMRYSWLIIDKHRCAHINVFLLSPSLSLFLFLSLTQVERKICSRTDCVVSYLA